MIVSRPQQVILAWSYVLTFPGPIRGLVTLDFLLLVSKGETGESFKPLLSATAVCCLWRWRFLDTHFVAPPFDARALASDVLLSDTMIELAEG